MSDLIFLLILLALLLLLMGITLLRIRAINKKINHNNKRMASIKNELDEMDKIFNNWKE